MRRRKEACHLLIAVWKAWHCSKRGTVDISSWFPHADRSLLVLSAVPSFNGFELLLRLYHDISDDFWLEHISNVLYVVLSCSFHCFVFLSVCGCRRAAPSVLIVLHWLCCVAPGGGVVQDCSAGVPHRTSVCLFGAEDSLEAVKEHVQVTILQPVLKVFYSLLVSSVSCPCLMRRKVATWVILHCRL